MDKHLIIDIQTGEQKIVEYVPEKITVTEKIKTVSNTSIKKLLSIFKRTKNVP